MGRKTKLNKITSPELLAQIDKDNSGLLRDFLDYLKSVQRSEKTIAGYKNDIEIAFVWNLLCNGNKFFVDWTKRNVIAFQNWMIGQNENSPARIRRIKASLSSLSNYIENVLDDEYPDFRNIINKVENPVNRPVREKTVWSDEELEALLDTLCQRGDYEKACVLALGMYGGRRKSELLRFRVSDFDESRLVCGGAFFKSEPIKTKGLGGGKMLPCYTLAKKFKPYLELWLRERSEKGIESEWLFPLRDDPAAHMKESTLTSWANAFTNITGRYFYWHSLRHRFVTGLAEEGLPDGVITQLLGWGSSDMCKVYNDMDADEQIAAFFENGEFSAPQNALSKLSGVK